MKSKKLMLVLATSVLVLTACGGDKKPDPTPTPGPEVIIPEFDRPTAEKFNGTLNLVGDDAAYLASLGTLERWAVEHFLTGLTLYDNTSYVMYHPSVVKGSQTYIPSYGFGIVREGYLNADLEGEANPEFKRYYHSVLAADPQTLKYMDSQESTVGTLVGNLASTLWGTRMNATKDDYEWYPEIAVKALPEVYDDPAATKGTKFKIEVDLSNLKYNTNSTISAIKAYDGKKVELEDFITPYQICYTKAFGMQRGAENLTGSGSLKGLEAYYNTYSDSGINEAAWANVGVDYETVDQKDYLVFEFNKETTCKDARAYLSSSMFNPVPKSFIQDVLGGGNMAAGVKQWGNYSTDYSTYSPLDTYLSTGPYTVYKWDKDQQIVYKKNPYYNDEDGTIYRIAGLHYNILPAIASDPNATFKEFLANKIHAATIPSDYLAEYLTDERTTVVDGDTTYRLNLNTCTQEFWNYNFGEDGVAYQNKPSDYWVCEPIMSNKYFDRGLSYAIDRLTLAGSLGNGPCCNFLSNAYLLGEGGAVYNKTAQHEAAIESLVKGTDGFGYSLDYAKACFKKASEQLIADGTYSKGDVIKLDVMYYASSQFDTEGIPVKNMIETAFNNCGGGLTLEITNTADDSDPYAVFDYLQSGRYDISIGAISGMEWWPLEFLETLKSNNSSGYTLGFGTDTSVCDGTLTLNLSYNATEDAWVYDPTGTAYSFSFDALWAAATKGTLIVNGEEAVLPLVFSQLQNPAVMNQEENTVDLVMYAVKQESDFDMTVTDCVFYYYDSTGYVYNEVSVAFDLADFSYEGVDYLVITAHIPAAIFQGDIFPTWTDPNYYSYTGVDIYGTISKDGDTILSDYCFGTGGYIVFQSED